MVLANACALHHELPQADQARDHENPDKNLLDGRVQLHFLVFYSLRLSNYQESTEVGVVWFWSGSSVLVRWFGKRFYG
jgi:hypothetical protein